MAIKYQLETIPVWDGITSQSECFICDLMKQSQEESLAFYLGSSVMNPETRIKVNTIGFCPRHTALLVESGRPNSMAVLWESHLEETRDQLKSVFNELEKASNPKKTSSKLDKILEGREKGCLICQRMQDRLNRYCYTIPYLWAQDMEFRKAFDNSKGFCLHHMSTILEMSIIALDSKNQKLFAQALAKVQQNNLERIAKDLVYMTEQYRSENANRPWNGCEDAQKRAVYKEIGYGRCDDSK